MSAPPPRCQAMEHLGHGWHEQCSAPAEVYYGGKWWCRRHTPALPAEPNTDRAQLAALGKAR